MKVANLIITIAIAIFLGLLLGWVVLKVCSVEPMDWTMGLIAGIETAVLSWVAMGLNLGTRGSQVVRSVAGFLCSVLLIVNLLLSWLWPNEVAVVLINGLALLLFAASSLKVINSGQ